MASSTKTGGAATRCGAAPALARAISGMETAASLIPRDPRDNQAQPGVDGNVSFVKRYAAALHHIRLRATLKRWPRSQGCAPARGTAARVGLCVALCSGRHNAQRSTAIVLPGGDKSI